MTVLLADFFGFPPESTIDGSDETKMHGAAIEAARLSEWEVRRRRGAFSHALLSAIAL